MSEQDNYATSELLTIDEAAMLLNIQPRSVQRAIWRGALPTIGAEAVRTPSQRLLRRPDVAGYAASRKTWKSKAPWPAGAPVH